MHALFEEAGKFMAGRILSEAESSAQVELDSGKRVKVKAANLLLKFEKPAPSELMAQAQALAQTIELPLAWEFAPEDDFGFADLARDYFSDNATLAQQAGALFALHEAPHYFRRAGKGRRGSFTHSERVAEYALLLARAMKLDRQQQQRIHIGAHLHDIGKNLVGMMLESHLFEGCQPLSASMKYGVSTIPENRNTLFGEGQKTGRRSRKKKPLPRGRGFRSVRNTSTFPFLPYHPVV